MTQVFVSENRDCSYYPSLLLTAFLKFRLQSFKTPEILKVDTRTSETLPLQPLGLK